MKGGKAKAETTRVDASLKRKGAGTQRAGKKTAKKEKAVKDPNKPKRPASAFFIFMEDFRVQYKQKHPNNKSVAAVGKAGGDKWKSMSEAVSKAPFAAKAEKRKDEYNKKMNAYNKKSAEGTNGADDEESDKSKSEVNDEDDEDGDDSAEEDEDDD
ncbi:hypothetical protein EUGRSUZ_J02535 [Eucalyptus grandis]|uniref:Uncharacterized protein n=2 Tax=Eucalyptus grandis TaxID=71139 RepID=A0ACC3J8G9_EUCGR|nr:hypothetical protein EUGRSUZ_J02535 [Eucalyptus grandis]